MKPCRWCGQTLPYRSEQGFSKRIDAEFCDEQCRNNCNNARRKLARKESRLQQLQTEIEALKQELSWDYDESEGPDMTEFAPGSDYFEVSPFKAL